MDEIRAAIRAARPGWASRIAGTARLADFANVDAGARKISSSSAASRGDRFGVNETSWNVRGDAKLNKFFDGRGLSLPVTAEYANSVSTRAPGAELRRGPPGAGGQGRARRRRPRGGRGRRASRRSTILQRLAALLDRQRHSSWSVLRNNNRSPFVIQENNVTSAQASYNLNPGQGSPVRLLRRFALVLPHGPGWQRTVSAEQWSTPVTCARTRRVWSSRKARSGSRPPAGRTVRLLDPPRRTRSTPRFRRQAAGLWICARTSRWWTASSRARPRSCRATTDRARRGGRRLRNWLSPRGQLRDDLHSGGPGVLPRNPPDLADSSDSLGGAGSRAYSASRTRRKNRRLFLPR